MQNYFNLKAIKPGILLLAASPVIYLTGLQLFLGESFSISRLFLTVLFTVGVFLLSAWLKYQPTGKGWGKYNLAWPILGLMCLVSAVVTAMTDSQFMAWIGLAAFLAVPLGVMDM